MEHSPVCGPSSLSLPEPWRPGPRSPFPGCGGQACPAVRGVALVGVQAVWSPFQESPALPCRWTVLPKPQGDREHVAGDSMAPFRILLLQKCGCQALGTNSLSTRLCDLRMTEASLSLGPSRNGSKDPFTGENCLEDHTKVKGQRRGS